LILLLFKVVLIPGLFTEQDGFVELEVTAVIRSFPLVPIKDHLANVRNAVSGDESAGSCLENVECEGCVAGTQSHEVA
jgi:hypothetical protein